MTFRELILEFFGKRIIIDHFLQSIIVGFEACQLVDVDSF